MASAPADESPSADLLSKQKTRARPSRTYSKRPAPDSGAEPSSKRQKSLPPLSPTPETESLPSLSTCASRDTTPGPLLTDAKKSSKGTILGYFKPLQRRVSSAPKPEPQPQPTPAPGLGADATAASEEEGDGFSDKEATTPPARRAERIRTSRRLRLKAVDFEASSLTNSPIPSPSIEAEGSTAKPTKKRSISAPSVQTTLALSNKPAFDECRVCGVLYNPLFPADVKFHGKVHAAALREQQQAAKRGNGSDDKN